MSQNYVWPSVSVTATNPSVGPNGSAIPGSSTLVAGENPSGNQQPLQTDSSGNLLVSGSFTPPALQNVNLTQVGGAAISEGQKTSSASLPVVIASDQSAIPISASSLPLPTGASTSALQTTGNSSLSTISGQLPTTLGQKLSAASLAVVLASDETVPVSVSSLPLPTGAATAANQATEIASLAAIQTSTADIDTTVGDISAQLPATLGQKTMANSLAVTLASDESTLPVSVASLPLPTGAATAANQATEISSLSTISSVLSTRLSGSLVPDAYDEIDLTYTGSNITLVEYKLATVLVRTLTLTYTGSNLTSVVAS